MDYTPDVSDWAKKKSGGNESTTKIFWKFCFKILLDLPLYENFILSEKKS